MAVNSNPQAVTFTNERIRPMADKLARIYYESKALVNDWFAQNVGSVILNNADTVDQPVMDGRRVVTGAECTNVVTRAIELVADMEANSNAKLNTVLAVAVNPGV